MTKIKDEWYWDGGLFSNTPLSPAIDALEEAADGDPCAVRELIVVELFPMNATIPRTMRDVLQRMVQLQYTSRLTLDEKFFEKTDRVVDLLAKIDQFVDLLAKIDGGLPEDIRSDPRYRRCATSGAILRTVGCAAPGRSTIWTWSPHLPCRVVHAFDFSLSSVEDASKPDTRTRSGRGWSGDSPGPPLGDRDGI